MENSRDQHIQQQIDRYIKGKLSEEEIQALWAEFLKNPDLLVDLEMEVNVREMLRRQMDNKAPETIEKRSIIKTLPSWTWKAAAAAAVLIVALLQLFKTDPALPLDKLLVQNISPEFVETANGVRNEDIIFSSADSLLNLGFAEFVDKDYDKALNLYNRVLMEYPEMSYQTKAHFNIGLIHYNQADFEEAISSFREVLARVEGRSMIREKALWFRANAMVRTGELEEARESMIETYQMEGIFEKRAFNILVRLNKKLGYPESDSPDIPKD